MQNERNNECLFISKVTKGYAAQMVDIYNFYVRESVATFDMEEWSQAMMEERINCLASRYPFFVCVSTEGTVKGYCYVHPWKEKKAYSSTLESTIYVAPNCRGEGIGTLLMERLILECRNEGVRVIVACITAGNEASEALHKKLGFEKVSHFRKVGIKFGVWLDVVDYELIF